MATLARWLNTLGWSSNPDSLRARFQNGFSWNVIGAILNNGSNFLTNIAIANLLGREIFGEYGMIQSTLTTFVGIAQAAGGITATKYVAEYRSSNKEKAGRVLGLCTATTAVTGGIATILILICAPWLSSTTLKAPSLAKPIQIAAAVVFFTVMNAYQTGALAGLESYRGWAIANALQGPVQLGLCTFSTWMWGLEGAVVGLLATSTARWMIVQTALKREAHRQGIVVRYHGLWQERSILLRFALPAAISGLSAAPSMWMANAFLVRQAGGYSQMAILSAALNLKNVAQFLPMLLNNVAASLLNNQRGERNHRRYRKLFWLNMLLTSFSALGGVVLIGLFGPHLLRLYGRTFPEGQGVLVLLLCTGMLDVLAMSLYQIIQAEEKMWISLLAIMLPRDIALVVLAYWLAPLYGAFGLGLAYLFSWVFYSLVVLIVVVNLGLEPKSAREGLGTSPRLAN